MSNDQPPEMQSKSANDYFPRHSPGTWPAALADALRSGDEPHAKTFEVWRGLVGLDASSVAVPLLSPVATKRPQMVTTAGTPNCVLEIVECDNVRALGDRRDPIVLSPWLTVFFGRNGSGKSSLAGALSVLGRVLGANDVPGLANEDPARDRFTGERGARFKVCALAGVRAQPGSYTGGTEAGWRSDGNQSGAVAMRLLDKKFIDEFGAQLRLDVPPQLGLEVFDSASATLQAFEGTLRTLRANVKSRRDTLIPEPDRALADAGVRILDTIAKADGDKLRRERDDLQVQVERLAKADVAAAAARKRIAALEIEQNYLLSLARPARDELSIRAALKERDELRKTEQAGLRGLLEKRPLKITNTQAWQKFVAAGEAVLEAEGTANYPAKMDSCIYCGQELGQAAVEFLSSVREEMQGARSARIGELSSQIQAASDAMRALTGRLQIDPRIFDNNDWPASIPKPDERVKHLFEVSEAIAAENKTLDAVATPESLASAREATKAKLEVSEIACFAKLNHARLTEYGALNTLDQSITEALTEIESQKRSWSTQKTIAMNALGLESFRKRFELECQRLQLRVPVQLKVASPAGVSERRYTVRGKEPRRTLSESEVATWALADTLSELAHRGGQELLLVDDPVSSMDTERMAQFAERVLDEAEQRQVVVFTHNRHFFHALVQQAKQHSVFKGKSGRGPAWYSVESFRGKTGLVSPHTTDQGPEALLERIQTTMDTGPLDEDRLGLCFLLTRRAIEVIIDQVILCGVRTLFDPEATETKWKDLKGIKQVPAHLIDALHDLHKGISRLGGLHNTGNFHLLCPITDDVRFFHAEVSRLLREIRAL